MRTCSMYRCIKRDVYVLFHEPLKEIYLWNLDCTPSNAAAVVPTDIHALISPAVVVIVLAPYKMYLLLLLFVCTLWKWNLFVLPARPDNTQNDIYEYWENKTN